MSKPSRRAPKKVTTEKYLVNVENENYKIPIRGGTKPEDLKRLIYDRIGIDETHLKNYEKSKMLLDNYITLYKENGEEVGKEETSEIKGNIIRYKITFSPLDPLLEEPNKDLLRKEYIVFKVYTKNLTFEKNKDEKDVIMKEEFILVQNLFDQTSELRRRVEEKIPKNSDEYMALYFPENSQENSGIMKEIFECDTETLSQCGFNRVQILFAFPKKKTEEIERKIATTIQIKVMYEDNQKIITVDKKTVFRDFKDIVAIEFNLRANNFKLIEPTSSENVLETKMESTLEQLKIHDGYIFRVILVGTSGN